MPGSIEYLTINESNALLKAIDDTRDFAQKIPQTLNRHWIFLRHFPSSFRPGNCKRSDFKELLGYIPHIIKIS